MSKRILLCVLKNEILGSGPIISIAIALSKHNWSNHYMASTAVILSSSAIGVIFHPIIILSMYLRCGGMDAADIELFRFNDRMLVENSLAN